MLAPVEGIERLFVNALQVNNRPHQALEELRRPPAAPAGYAPAKPNPSSPYGAIETPAPSSPMTSAMQSHTYASSTREPSTSMSSALSFHYCSGEGSGMSTVRRRWGRYGIEP